MGAMMRRMRRNARRRIGELVEMTFGWLDLLEDDAYDQRDAQARAWCQQAVLLIDDSLTDDGKPTDRTAEALVEALEGPIARAAARLRPDIPFPFPAQDLAAE